MSVDSYFGDGVRMDGTLKFKGTIRFDGEFTGKVLTDGVFVVGKSGNVNAEVNAGHVLNMGRLTGRIKAGRKVSMLRDSYTGCAIDTPALRTEEGAIFRGNCVMPFDNGTDGGASKSTEEVIAENIDKAIKKRARRKKSFLGTPSSPLFRIFILLAFFAASGMWYVDMASKKILKDKISQNIYAFFAANHPAALEKLADILVKEGDYESAVEQYAAARRLKPGRGDLTLKLAVALEDAGRLDEAVPHFEEYLRKNPDTKSIAQKLSEYYAYTKDVDGQIRILELITRNAPENRIAADRLFRLYRAQGMNEKALAFYAKKLASRPMSARDLVTILRLEKELGRSADAVKTAKKLAARYPENVEGHLELARWFLKQGKDAKAESELRMVAALDPDSPENNNNTALAAIARKKYDAAIKGFNSALKKEPGNLRALYGLVTVYNKKKDYENVKLYAKKALAIEPDFASVLNRLAWAMAVSGENLKEAEKISKASLKLNPNSAGYMDTLSEIYYRAGDSGKAVEWINRAIKLEPKSRWYKSQLRKFRKGPPKTGKKKK